MRKAILILIWMGIAFVWGWMWGDMQMRPVIEEQWQIAREMKKVIDLQGEMIVWLLEERDVHQMERDGKLDCFIADGRNDWRVDTLLLSQ